MRDILKAKRDGRALRDEEIARWIRGVTDGTVPDYQSAALLMAIVWRGMTREEELALTRALLESGRSITWTGLDRPTVDKHSTGGVGDKISIALAPWVAACGAAVPMIAGRGLGHTGGTLDKLEAIPGFKTRMGVAAFEAQIRRVHVAIVGQSEELAPADGALYALRDVTATVESLPLIVASILSKKAASGAASIVFDVKCGKGAFFPEREQAHALARELVEVASLLGIHGSSLLTSMDEPLGDTIGNANETAEAFAVLRGGGPEDVVTLTRALGAVMLRLAGLARDDSDAHARLEAALRSGDALRRAEAMVEAQGGDPRAVTDPGRLPAPAAETPIPAPRTGTIAAWDARCLGEVLVALGGGRRKKEDAIDPAVGIRLLRKRGAAVRAGEDVAVVATRPGDAGGEALRDAILGALTIGDRAPATPAAGEGCVGPSIVLEQVTA